MTIQKRNAEQVKLLSVDFIHKTDNAYLWAMTPGAFLMLPSLRAFWPMSTNNESPRVWSLVNQAELVEVSSPTFGAYGLAPYCELPGSAYLRSPVDATLETTGAITAGLWVNIGLTDTPIYNLWQSGAEQWQIYSDSNQYLNFKIQKTATVYTVTAGSTFELDTWLFVVARFTPSTALDLFVDGVKSSNTTSIPATMDASSQRITIGAPSDGSGTKLTGKVSMAFLCHAALSDVQITALYGLTRGLFGVE